MATHLTTPGATPPQAIVAPSALRAARNASIKSSILGSLRCKKATISATPAADVEEWCREAGADVYIEKSAGASEIAAALRAMLLSDSQFGDLEDGEAKAETKLSKRQKQLIVMLDEGLSNREIAERLGISEHTVKVHLWRLFRRLGVKSRTQTLHFARMNGLLNS